MCVLRGFPARGWVQKAIVGMAYGMHEILDKEGGCAQACVLPHRFRGGRQQCLLPLRCARTLWLIIVFISLH